ncbi:hypothetical protein A2755_01165 [Candidatus Wolfebacteria bacterium RIFCSPHIGHO2_01_FULL_48_22]|uniref:Glycosyltransferase subfamily 4-like N-terminal domain-containing protein n=2 Tax=Candidatus Wolfeibacteriota TaxID=1752735 RepID=A0A1F8DWC2_9BACT|nr:MAG: hypothetical protein A2755_01165 [Candidatus Wolfebacteria bacterium RIFCSPHIGHO2_01_FULL_48_22]OGM93936.1 MAG: hypothetical protein A2935_03630 [Candidatus Wolfebacteria bacterium RIFCSPLOWO2_01_FULL_47_17b]
MNPVLIFHTPITFGGGETQLLLMCRDFLGRGRGVQVVNLARSEEFERALAGIHVPFYTITAQGVGFSPTRFSYVRHMLRILLLAIRDGRLRKLYREHPVVWARGFPANFFVVVLSFLYGRKSKRLIYSHHFLKSPEQRATRAAYLRVLRVFDSLVGVSHEVSESLRKVFPELTERILTIPNAVDMNRFALGEGKDELRRKLSIPEGVVGVYLARFSPQKNHAFLVDVLKRVPGFTLVLGGEGSELQNFMDKAKQEHIDERVKYCGHIHSSLVPMYLRAADFCVFPSIGEGFSNAVLEALASDLPVVLFREVYSPELGDAVLIADSYDDFFEKVQELCTNLVLRQTMSAKAREVVHSFDVAVTAQAYLELFDKNFS